METEIYLINSVIYGLMHSYKHIYDKEIEMEERELKCLIKRLKKNICNFRLISAKDSQERKQMSAYTRLCYWAMVEYCIYWGAKSVSVTKSKFISLCYEWIECIEVNYGIPKKLSEGERIYNVYDRLKNKAIDAPETSENSKIHNIVYLIDELYDFFISHKFIKDNTDFLLFGKCCLRGDYTNLLPYILRGGKTYIQVLAYLYSKEINKSQKYKAIAEKSLNEKEGHLKPEMGEYNHDGIRFKISKEIMNIITKYTNNTIGNKIP